MSSPALVLGKVVVIILTVSLILPVMFPQATACKANLHALPSVGTSVQVTVV